MLPCPPLTPVFLSKEGDFCVASYFMHAHLRFIPRNELCFRGWNGVEGERGRGQTLASKGRTSSCGRGKAKAVAEDTGHGEKGGRDSHKRRPKVRCHFFGMQLREEGAKGFEKWRLFSIYLCCQFHREERKPSQIFQEKAKLSLNCTLQRSGKHLGPLEKKNLGHTWFSAAEMAPFLYCLKFKYSKSAGHTSSSPLTLC